MFNMEPAHECSSDKLGFCPHSKKCYAKKAERQYPTSLRFRQRQKRFWKRQSVEYICENIIEEVENSGKYKINYIRFNESGDFENQKSLDKLKSLCEALLNHKETEDIVVYGYTARRDLNFEDLPKNLVINGSNFMVSNEYRPIDGSKINQYTNYCPGMAHKYTGGCQGCNKCKTATGEVIYAAYH